MRIPPSVEIIVPAMDRTAALAESLPSLMSQDYPRFGITVVDVGSKDGLPELLSSQGAPQLRHVRCSRPTYYSHSRAFNMGLRYSDSDLVLILGTESFFEHPQALNAAVQCLAKPADEPERGSMARWRESCGYPPRVNGGMAPPNMHLRFPRVYGLAGGGLILVERAAVQALGGYNELLRGWGYEDGDLNERLEMAGFGKVALAGIQTAAHGDDLRTALVAVKEPLVSWQRNRQVAELMSRKLGITMTTSRFPGRARTVTIDGVTVDGRSAPQQDWEQEVRITADLVAHVRYIDRAMGLDRGGTRSVVHDLPANPGLPQDDPSLNG